MLPFGGGMGRLRLTCGAVSGMAAIIGLLFADQENSSENKKQVYALTQKLCNEFKEEQGSLICSELLQKMNVPVEVGGVAEARTKEYYKKRSCADTVYCAAYILEKYLKEVGKI
jgi:C_GCAxxG_C_C family probable redox protein